MRGIMFYRSIFQIIFLLNCFFLRADLFDLFMIDKSINNIPLEVQDLIAKKYLKNNPFPLTPTNYTKLVTPACSFKIKLKEPWGLAFVENDILAIVHDDRLSYVNKKLKIPGRYKTKNNTIIPILIITDYENRWLSSTLHKIGGVGITTSDIMCPENHCIISVSSNDEKRTCNFTTLKISNEETIGTILDSQSVELYIATLNHKDFTKLHIWKRSNALWKKVLELEHPHPIYSASFNNDFTEIATSCADNILRVWKIDNELVNTSIINFMPNNRMNIEQLLFLKLINKIYRSQGFVTIENISHRFYDKLVIGLAEQAPEVVAAYLNNVLDSFGEFKNTLIHRYNLSEPISLFNKLTTSCSIQ